MPKLVITKEGQSIDEYLVEDEDTIIGRAQECDITVSDESVSRRHLRIICILGDCFLEDLNSANGTLVNSRLTKKCPLEDGDIISIGHHEIVYKAATTQQGTSEEEFDKTRVKLIKQLGKPGETEAGSGQGEADSTEPESTLDAHSSKHNYEDLHDTTVVASQNDTTIQEPAQTVEPEPESEIVSEAEPGLTPRTKAENPKERIGNLKVISGRREGHNMILSKSVTGIDKSGQRVAAITRRPDGYFLVPLGDGDSDNVTVLINGNEIKRKIYPLWSNDIIELGETEMEFLLEE